jgi:hypothetical protein
MNPESKYITEDDSDPFLIGANLDTRGRPLNLANLTPDDGTDLFLEGSNLVRERDLRRELEKLADDPTVLAQLAQTDPAAAEKLEELRNEDAALQFIESHPGYFVCEANSDRLSSWLESQNLPMTAENLGRAYDNLQAAGALAVSPHVFRVVPESERIRLARMAANGDPQTALSAWLSLRVPSTVAAQMSNAEDYWAVERLLSDPALQQIYAEGLTETWFWSHPNVRPSSELRDWFKSYTKDMVVFNWKTLDASWIQFFDHRETQNEIQKRNALLGLRGEPETPETPEEVAAGLEDLSDSEISRLMRGVTRERAGRPA